jgi:hypothetical protein
LIRDRLDKQEDKIDKKIIIKKKKKMKANGQWGTSAM